LRRGRAFVVVVFFLFFYRDSEEQPDQEPPDGESMGELERLADARSSSEEVGMGRLSGLGEVWKPGAVWEAPAPRAAAPELLGAAGEAGDASSGAARAARAATLLRFFLPPSGEGTSAGRCAAALRGCRAGWDARGARSAGGLRGRGGGAGRRPARPGGAGGGRRGRAGRARARGALQAHNGSHLRSKKPVSR
jgi:hypothetical protein